MDHDKGHEHDEGGDRPPVTVAFMMDSLERVVAQGREHPEQIMGMYLIVVTRERRDGLLSVRAGGCTVAELHPTLWAETPYLEESVRLDMYRHLRYAASSLLSSNTAPDEAPPDSLN